ncbi:MAG: glycosyl hydrolase 53 family protein [Panacibacter sp.]
MNYKKAFISIALIFMQTILFAQKDKSEKILGADISFLPQLEDKGIQFSVDGVEGDAIAILKQHGFNYIRLRIFNDPGADSGYSPGKDYCGLEQTKAMAKRIKIAGLKFLLDFHYSDTWADPGKQFKPAAWEDLSFDQLTKAVRGYTKDVLFALKQQGTLPDMVQIGNEINHGMIWPDGKVENMDNLAALFKAGAAGVKDIDGSIPIMLHLACGGQNAESVSFIDNMLKRNARFDIIGESYYPQWHGTIEDLRNNLNDLSKRYKQDVIVVEYTMKKNEVNEVAFTIPDGKMKGTFIWEPLNTWEFIFDKDGKANDLLKLYPEIARKYNIHLLK